MPGLSKRTIAVESICTICHNLYLQEKVRRHGNACLYCRYIFILFKSSLTFLPNPPGRAPSKKSGIGLIVALLVIESRVVKGICPSFRTLVLPGRSGTTLRMIVPSDLVSILRWNLLKAKLLFEIRIVRGRAPAFGGDGRRFGGSCLLAARRCRGGHRAGNACQS